MNTSQIKAHIALIVVNVIYGVNFIAVKEIIPHHFEWQSLALFRGFGTLFLCIAAWLWGRRKKIERADVGKFIVAGLLGVTVSQSLLVWGLQHTSAINASIIMTTTPLFVMLFAAFILRFPMTKHKIWGIILGGAGACVLILSSNPKGVESVRFISLGDAIIFANAVSFGLYLVLTKPLMAKYDSITVMFYTFVFGTLPILLYGLQPTLEVDFSTVPVITYIAIGFVIVFATFITYILNAASLEYVNPTTVSIYVYIQPVVATILSMTMHHEQFHWYKIPSMLLVFAGVYLVSKSNSSGN
ncbi:MAG: DMT family transporter [Bacteroidales bacterium]|jgi:drug/metabolite transporter (DMT)-like permease|nr:DMT family transporter [Bacteroidales bacterium]